MSIREAWTSNIRKHGEGFDPDWNPAPGDAICDTQDPLDTYGIIIAVLPKVERQTPKVLVLWTRHLKPDPMDTSGFVYASYIPLQVTPTIFAPEKGLFTRYAKKLLKPEWFGSIKIEDIK